MDNKHNKYRFFPKTLSTNHKYPSPLMPSDGPHLINRNHFPSPKKKKGSKLGSVRSVFQNFRLPSTIIRQVGGYFMQCCQKLHTNPLGTVPEH